MNVDAILARTHVEGDCLIWEGAEQSKGYGSAADGKGGTQLVHRAVFEAKVRRLKWGETIDHTCRRILCVNVAHHEPVSRAENSRRRIAAQTHCKQNHPLSGENVRLLTRRNGYTYRVCLTCQRARNRAWMRARRAEAVAS